jgi:hypothetical protein
MNKQTTLFPNISEPKRARFITHFYSKSDIMKVWNIQDHKQFERFIGSEGIKVLDWKPGKQKFTPKQFRELIAIVGLPLEKEELISSRRVGT